MKWYHLSLLLSIAALTINWRSAEQKENIIFFGTLTTYEGNTYEVTHIALGNARHTKQIPFYEKPQKAHKVSAETTDNKHRKEIILKKNPKKELVATMIDLNEIQELSVPSPNIVWTYQKGKDYRKDEYLEVTITSKGNAKKTSYLLEHSMNIYCNGISPAGPEERKVPLAAIKQLYIKGYYFSQQVQSNHMMHQPTQSKKLDQLPPGMHRIPSTK